jgi:hypothetical protein
MWNINSEVRNPASAKEFLIQVFGICQIKAHVSSAADFVLVNSIIWFLNRRCDHFICMVTNDNHNTGQRSAQVIQLCRVLHQNMLTRNCFIIKRIQLKIFLLPTIGYITSISKGLIWACRDLIKTIGLSVNLCKWVLFCHITFVLHLPILSRKCETYMNERPRSRIYFLFLNPVCANFSLTQLNHHV